MEVVPEGERPTYMGLANTTLGLVTFLPVFSGWLIGLLGYRGIFALALAFALLGLVSSLRLGEADAPAEQRLRRAQVQ